jgi:hypothetical protein
VIRKFKNEKPRRAILLAGEGFMKQWFCVGMLLALLLSTAPMAAAFRCENGLAVVGDHSFQVLQKCGAPISQEVVGYTLSRDRKRELKMEHWVYGPTGGLYYVLVFEGGILKKIFDFRQP